MGSIKDIKQAVEARMVALAFEQSDEEFDFDSEPDSQMDKLFRVKIEMEENRYYSDNLSNPLDNIIIWIAYKTKRNKRTAGDAALDDRETIEVDLINHASITGLASDPLLTMDKEAVQEKYLENYLISRLVFTADYIRDVSA